MNSLKIFKSIDGFKKELDDIINKTIIISKEQDDDCRDILIESEQLSRAYHCNSIGEKFILDNVEYEYVSFSRKDPNIVRIIIRDTNYGFYFSCLAIIVSGIFSQVDSNGNLYTPRSKISKFDLLRFEKNYPIPQVVIRNFGESELLDFGVG